MEDSPPHEFTLHLGKKRTANVRIFGAQDEMVTVFSSELDGRKREKYGDRNFKALTVGQYTGREIARFYFCSEYLSPGIVAHELQHLLIIWMSRENVDMNRVITKNRIGGLITGMEESLCRKIGGWTTQFWDEVNSRPVI